MKTFLENLKVLSLARGASGDEGAVRKMIYEEVLSYPDCIAKTDNAGNLIVFKKGKNEPKNKLMFSAHMDEVGFMVRSISREGAIDVLPVGNVRMAARQLQDYLLNGNITNSVNMPNVSHGWSGIARLCLIHKNIPGMLTKITTTLSDDGINVENMTNKSKKDYAYTMVDVNTRITDEVADELRAIPGVIRVRVLNH